MTHVKAAADQGCQFCGLSLEALEDVDKPEYFYNNAFGGDKTILTPKLYVHMLFSEKYKEEALNASSRGLRANRLFVELGGRLSGVRNS